MLIPGLVSITFRNSTPHQVIYLAQDVGFQVIEWGGDIHVPHGMIQQAENVARWTTNAGLSVAAYGSYYRVGVTTNFTFEQVLETALALGAPTIRVWAGDEGSAYVSEAERQRVYEDAHRIAGIAAEHNVTVSFEFHDNTLTDTAVSAVALMHGADHPNLRMYWQPPHRISDEERLQSLDMVMQWLTNVHVFQWHRKHPQVRQRYPLTKGKSDWKPYLERLQNSGHDHAVMLEFVHDDNPDQFRRDAATLLNWLE